MQEVQSARIIAFPGQPVANSHPPRVRLECMVTTSPLGFALSDAQSLTERCQRWMRAFEKKNGFSLPGLNFDQHPDLSASEWTLSMRGRELHQGKITNPNNPLESIFQELLDRSWKVFTYEMFRVRLQELEEWEPFLVQEVASRLDLVLAWQAFQALLKNGGSLHRFSSKLERLLVEGEGRSREHLMTPRMLSALQQI